MLRPEYGDELATQIRRDFWSVGFTLIREHPLTGIGLGNFTAYSYSATPGAATKHGMACNTFLEIAAELGIPGFLAYCGVSVAALRSAEKLRSEGKRRKDVLLFYAGEAMQTGLLGFLGAAMFVSAEYQKPFWVIVALTATSQSLLTQSSFRTPRVKSSLMRAHASNCASTAR
jgi:O-antigen ligase